MENPVPPLLVTMIWLKVLVDVALNQIQKAFGLRVVIQLQEMQCWWTQLILTLDGALKTVECASAYVQLVVQLQERLQLLVNVLLLKSKTVAVMDTNNPDRLSGVDRNCHHGIVLATLLNVHQQQEQQTIMVILLILICKMQIFKFQMVLVGTMLK